MLQKVAVNMKKNVLILCTGNSCRSQMAEGILKKFGNDKYEVYSAGTAPSQVNAIAIQVMQEIDIDISQQSSDHVTQYLDKDIDYVITVCGNAKESCPIFPGKTITLHWPFPDPPHDKEITPEVINEFRKVRDAVLTKFRHAAQNGFDK